MDNLAFTLLGLALAFSRLGRGLSRRAAVIIGVLAANLPDADLVLWPLRGQSSFVFGHATVSHSLLALVVGPLLLGGLGVLARLPFRRVAALAGAALFGHVALDASGIWGVAPLAPFSALRVGLGWTGSTDFVVWAVLSLPLWAPRVSGVARERVAELSLALVVLWVGLLGGGHALAVGRARATAEAAGFAVDDVEAFASPFLPTLWSGVVTAGEHVAVVRVSLLGESKVQSVHLANRGHAAMQAVAATEAGARWLSWARAPVADVVCLTDGAPTATQPGSKTRRVALRLVDLRFADAWVERPVGALRFELEYTAGRPYRVTGHSWVTPWTGDVAADESTCADGPAALRDEKAP